jgi:hypothetical protein
VIDPAGECLGQAVGGLGERFGDITPIGQRLRKIGKVHNAAPGFIRAGKL